jgi:RNA polymerase sigma-70 factor, ECF subfamily
LEDDSDEALMRCIANSDPLAFRALLERHTRRMLSLARNTVAATGVAEEIVQEAFVRVWQHAGSFDARRSLFTTWMHRIVINLCLDHVRRPQHASSDDLDEVADDAPDALGEMLGRERRAAVQAAMRALPVRQRAALVLFHFQGASLREAAAAMELSEKAFESLLTRARAALRNALHDYMHDDGERP